MKQLLIRLFLGVALVCGVSIHAQETPTAPTVDPVAEAAIKDLLGKINDQISQGKSDEAQYADILHQADDIYAKHKIIKMLFLKIQLYQQVFTNDDRIDNAIACAEQIKKDNPDPSIDQLIEGLKDNAARMKIFSGLKPGVAMPDFSEKDSAGQPLSLAAHKGKVVLVDFWATWCPPCMGEFPNVKKVYEKYHDKGFDIVGVDLDDDRGKFDAFLKAENVTWPQYYDGLHWTNKLVLKYGVMAIPATILLDTNGVIIAKSIRGEALADAVDTALKSK